MSHNRQSDRVAVFVDGANLHHAARGLGLHVDYRKLSGFFETFGTVFRKKYYTGITERDGDNPLIRSLDWLSYNGWIVETKPTKRTTRNDGSAGEKGNMDVEITIDAMRLAETASTIILVSGDGDFRALVDHLQGVGCRVVVLSGRTNIADELKRQADLFITLESIAEDIRSPPRNDQQYEDDR